MIPAKKENNRVRPIIIQGHTRPLTMVKYNREGDLLVTSAKDNRPCLWYADNGERIGTYDGHTGTVWCVDFNCAWPPSLLLPPVARLLFFFRCSPPNHPRLLLTHIFFFFAFALLPFAAAAASLCQKKHNRQLDAPDDGLGG